MKYELPDVISYISYDFTEPKNGNKIKECFEISIIN